jgi:hypothetical protein
MTSPVRFPKMSPRFAVLIRLRFGISASLRFVQDAPWIAVARNRPLLTWITHIKFECVTDCEPRGPDPGRGQRA